MRVLFLNFRDLSHPAAGGAEVFTEEVGKRLVNYGNEVTILASAFEGSEHETIRSGMTLIRRGGKYSVYPEARKYVKQHIAEFDVIIDEINTVPFQIPRIVKNKPVIALIHQLARQIWFYETKFPLNLLGYFALEPLWLRGYRQVPTITVSNSTRKDLESRGFQEIYTVYNGIGAKPLSQLPEKAPNPVLAFVGRLVRSKRPDHAILAFKSVRRTFPNAELWILGEGYMRSKLDKMTAEGVVFFGRVSEGKKFELLKRAHVLLVPSIREGWGVSVMEANSMGTPAIGYDVHGLEDSIIDNLTGLRVREDPGALAKAAIDLLQDVTLLKKLSMNALHWSEKFDWDTSAQTFCSILSRHSQTS